MIRVLFHIKNAIYSVFWYLWNIGYLEAYFESKGIINIRINLFHLWKPNAQYFSGNIKSSNQKVFIKFGKKYFIQRESNALHYLSKKLPSKPWLPTIIDSEVDWIFPNLIFDYIEGKPLYNIGDNRLSNQFSEALTLFLMDVVESFDSIKTIHRDIRSHNIIVGSKNEMYLIDYAFLLDVSAIEPALVELPKTFENLEKLHRLGNGCNPSIGVWDDAYSIHKIFRKYQVEESQLTIIKEKIGKLMVQINGED